jgi:guanylate cyclase soluble subunit beta
MYGLVNAAVRSLVLESAGDAAWAAVRDRAGAPDEFAPLQAYDDGVTYALVGAAVEVLGLPADQILRTFGRYWVERVATVHYRELMDRTGADFVSFVRHLDALHTRMRSSFPEYRPPSFRVIALEPGLLQVDYYSEREGLLPFVEGLFEGLGAHFGEEVELEHVPDDSHPLPCKRMRLRHRPAA